MPPKPIMIVVLAFAVWSVPATAQRLEALRDLQSRVERLQAELDRVESVRAIKRLQYAYGHYVEFGLWNDFADLFTEDAVTNYQQGARGREAVRRLFFDRVGQGKLGLSDGRIYPHILFQPVITLAPDGRTAKGRWRILAMLGGYGGAATWYSGVYENEYVMEDGVWKIAVLHSEPKVTAPYTALGWKNSGVHVPFHYTAGDVTAPIPDSAGLLAPKTGSATPDLTELVDRVSQLVRRAARLKDQAEVTNLQDTYGYAVDRKLWDQAASLFVRDGTLELGLRGVYSGRASIRHAFDQFGPQGLREGERNDHVYLETVVSVAPEGGAAWARGIELIMSSADGGELGEGVFENSFVQQEGRWKIQSVHFYPRMIVDAAAGWGKSAKPAPGPGKEFPPDRPPTVSYEIYPKFVVPPFHFNNPVTGRPPQYPEQVLTAAKASRGAAAAPPRERAVGNVSELAAGLADLERAVATAKAYDAVENMIGAYAYYLDESSRDLAGLFAKAAVRSPAPDKTVLVNQILQPVIEVAADGKSAKVRARLLDLGNTSEGRGYWTAGVFEGHLVSDHDNWRFRKADSTTVWSARYPGGWSRTQ